MAANRPAFSLKLLRWSCNLRQRAYNRWEFKFKMGVPAVVQEQSFATTYDLPSKLISAAVVAVFVVVFIITKNALACVFGLCVITLAYLYSPQSYEVSGRSILIKRLIGTVRLPLDNIRELRAGTAADFRRCIRLWANGGLFGYYGWFKTAKLGKCRWYMTNRSNSVIVVNDERTVVLSPSDVPGFLASVRNVVPVPEISEGEVAKAIHASRAGVPVGGWVGGAVAILVACVVCFSLMYSPGPPKLTLTSNSLTIHDHFYPVTVNAADIDLSDIRVVNIQTDQAWKPTVRTNGFANAYYHSGWFHVASGSARMYWADGARLVLLPPRRGGAPVLFQVNDPEQFVETVRKEWASN
jgi:hypothetical protein